MADTDDRDDVDRGLWFGVSKVESPGFRLALMALAAIGNLGLVLVLQRLRYIKGEYLAWLGQAYPAGHVAADSGRLVDVPSSCEGSSKR